MRVFTLFTLFLIVFLPEHSLFAQTGGWRSKVDTRLLAEAEHGRTVHFLVVFAEQADLNGADFLKTKAEKGRFVFEKLRATAARSQAGLSQIFQEKKVFANGFFIANLMAVEAGFDILKLAAERPEVARIERDPEMTLDFFDERNVATDRGPEWNVQMIKADSVWAMGIRGQGVTVAGEDTGYEWENAALKPSYRGWNGATADHNFNWWDAIHEFSPLSGDTLNPCGRNLQAPCDDHNHGTHTMGTMVGDDSQGNQIGIAPDARWMACRNMERGNGRPSTYIECFQFFLAPTDLAGQNANPLAAPHVINNSWYCSVGEGCDSSFNLRIMENVIKNLQKAGIFVVVSNGNFGPSCSTTTGPPAVFEPSFCVGATRSDDSIAVFSSRGPGNFDGKIFMKPNVSAPGQGVRSCIRGGNFAAFSGTSMAGPHVAGLVALLISANPELAGRVDDISKIIEATAVRKFSEQDCGGVSSDNFPNNVYGWGRIDALAAVKMARGLAKIEPNVQVWPNPFHAELSFEFTNIRGEIRLEFFDTAGRLVAVKNLEADRSFTTTFYSPDIETDNRKPLPGGLYFYRISCESGQFCGKLVKI